MSAPPTSSSGSAAWTFLTNHAHVLLCIARDPQVRLRDVAVEVGITERAAQRIVADLAEAHYLTRRRVGRRNCYEVHADRPLRHPADGPRNVAFLLGLLGEDDAPSTPERGSSRPRQSSTARITAARRA